MSTGQLSVSVLIFLVGLGYAWLVTDRWQTLILPHLVAKVVIGTTLSVIGMAGLVWFDPELQKYFGNIMILAAISVGFIGGPMTALQLQKYREQQKTAGHWAADDNTRLASIARKNEK